MFSGLVRMAGSHDEQSFVGSAVRRNGVRRSECPIGTAEVASGRGSLCSSLGEALD
jgi:hypothetical protein